MTYAVHKPDPPLDEFVDHMWQFDDHRVASNGGRLFADGCGDLMWNLSAPLRAVRGDSSTTWRAGWVSGQRQRPLTIELEQRCFTMIGVRFHPGGMPALLGAPAIEFVDEVIDLREFWGGTASELHDRLASARSCTARFEVLEQALLRRVQLRKRPRQGLSTMVAHMLQHPQRLSISLLERELAVGHRHLCRLFAAQVGMSPKAFQRVARFRALVRALAGITQPNWAGLALRVGYADQAHLCREFRAFTGMTPSRFWLPTLMPSYMPWADMRLIAPPEFG